MPCQGLARAPDHNHPKMQNDLRFYYQCYKDWWIDGRSTSYMITHHAISKLNLTVNVSPVKPRDLNAKPISVILTEWATAQVKKKAEQGQT